MSLIFWPEDVHGSDQFGVKGLELLSLTRAGIPVPEWFLLPAEGFYASLLEQEYDVLLRYAKESNPPKLKFSFQLDYDLNREIEHALDRLCPHGERVAVRYSPSLEGGRLPPRGSESHLFVATEDVARAIRAVWKAHFSQDNMRERVKAGFPAVPKAPAIVIQRMLDPEASGFCFSANPVTGARSEAVVHAVFGLPTLLVSPDTPRDVCHVSEDGHVVSRMTAEKHTRHACHHDSQHGIVQLDVPAEKAASPAISDLQAVELATFSRRIAQSAGCPQRIDWAIEKGVIYVLAARDIQELKGMPDPDAVESLWDFAPLANVVPGVVSPLAGSLCRRSVIEGWCEAMRSAGFSRVTMTAVAALLDQAIGWVEGRLCLNRLALARALSRVRLPKNHRALFASLFGCSLEQLAEASSQDEVPRARPEDVLSLPGNSLAVNRLAKVRPRIRKEFSVGASRLAALLAGGVETGKPERILALLQSCRALSANVFALYSRATMQVIHRWNELRLLTRGRCGDHDGNLVRSLVVPHEPMAVEDVLDKLSSLASKAARHKRLTDALRAGRHYEADSILATEVSFADDYKWLIDQLGKVTSWVEGGEVDDGARARALLATVCACGAPVDFRLESPQAESHPGRLAKVALDKIDKLLKGDPASGKLVRAAMHRMHHALCTLAAMREGVCAIWNAYGRAYVRLGQSLFEAGALELPDDVVWLTEEELISHLDARVPDMALSEVVCLRKRAYEESGRAQDGPPALMFTAHGCLRLARQTPRRKPGDLREGVAKTVGIGCGTGTLRARVRLLEEPSCLTLRSGEVLALPVADIRFRFHLHTVGGLIIEHGSAADQLVVLALRLGKPVVLGPLGVLKWLREGETIEIQAGSGTIRKTGSASGIFS